MKTFLSHKYKRPCINSANYINTTVRLYVISEGIGDYLAHTSFPIQGNKTNRPAYLGNTQKQLVKENMTF